MQTEKYGGLYIAQIFQKQGIEHVFTLTGGHVAPILIACKRLGIKVIDVRQEVTTVFAADAYSRLSNKVGVAIVTAGPGITNTVTAVKNAQMAQSPIVIIGGATLQIYKNRGSLQDIDQLGVMKTVVKWQTTVKSYQELWKVSEAFYKAREGVPGPVFVEIGIDILWPLEKVKTEFSTSRKSLDKSLQGKFIKWYIDRYTKKTFAGAETFNVPDPREIPNKIFSPNQIQKIVSMIQKAEKPVLLIGSQAIEYKIVPAVVDAVNKLGMPVYLSGMARGLLSNDAKLQFRHKRKEALRESDLVILAGVPNDFRLDYGRSINRKAFLISVNLSIEDLTKNRKPTLGIKNHPGTFLIVLSKELNGKQQNWSEWFATLNKREEERNQEILDQSKEKMGKINPLAMSLELENFLNDNSILIGDGGDIIATISYIVRPRKPLSWLDPGPFGTLGVGAGFALAAKILYPEKDVFLIYGDGSVGYSLIEWDTFTRHKIPIIGIIGNDSGWMQVAREQIEVFNDAVGTELGDRNYERVVEGFGAKGFLVNNLEEFSGVLHEALKISKNKQSVLINVMIGRSEFRKGSISM